MGKKMDDEMLILEIFWLIKSWKGLLVLFVMFNFGVGVRFVDSCDGNNNVVSLWGNIKSFYSVKFFKVDCNSFVSIFVKGGSGSFKNGESDDLEYVNVDIIVDEL